jgi:hypothetical protein
MVILVHTRPKPLISLGLVAGPGHASGQQTLDLQSFSKDLSCSPRVNDWALTDQGARPSGLRMQQSAKMSFSSEGARPQRSRKSARSWGDINLTLNRMVREGVIAGFKTNLSSPDRSVGLRVTITPPAVSADEAEAIRARVEADLEALVEGVVVTMDQHEPA